MATKKAQRTARKAAPTKTAARPKSWNNSEILYAVLGYLTTREEPLILSASHDAAPVAEVLGMIIEANGLPGTRPEYPKIKIPERADKIRQHNPADAQAINCAPPPPKTPDEIAGKILNLLLNQSPEDQNKVMANVVTTLGNARKKEHEYLTSERNRYENAIEQSHKNNETLAGILKQSF